MNNTYTDIMRRAGLSVLALGMLVAPCRTVWPQTYDIDTYISAVRACNKDLKLAEEEKETATIQQKEALSTALPRVGLETEYDRNLTDYYMYFDKSAPIPGTRGLIKAPIKRDNQFSATVALQQTLYSNEVGSAIKASKQYSQLTDYTLEATRQAVVTSAKKLFYQCLLLEQVADITRAAETNALDNFNDTQLKYDNGQVSQFELLQAETRWRMAVPEVQQAERDLALSMNVLKNLAGIDVDDEIELAGSLLTIPGMPGEPSLDVVYDARPDLQALSWQKDLLQTNLDATKGAYQPKVTGTLAYAYSTQSNKFSLDEENNLWFVGVNLSMPIYTGGYIKSQIQKAAVQLKKTDITIEKNRDAIATDVINAYLRLKEANLRIESADAARETAEKAFHIAESSSRDGLATQLQLKDARLGYDQTTILYYSAVFDYLSAYFDWEYAAGTM